VSFQRLHPYSSVSDESSSSAQLRLARRLPGEPRIPGLDRGP
jgi:hypothetical protein